MGDGRELLNIVFFILAFLMPKVEDESAEGWNIFSSVHTWIDSTRLRLRSDFVI